MPLKVETWFPLAVGYDDLSPPPEIKAGMLQSLAPLVDAHIAAESDRFAWTGDRRGHWQLHTLPAFRWIRREVERQTIAYARVLGANLAVMGFYFQRSWAVLSRQGEYVPKHSHPNANLSAVYYLQTPGNLAEAGRILFHNDAEQNSLGKGFSLRDTAGILDWNPLNYLQTGYQPIENRLLLFPSQQPHSVETNRTDELRISLSFDIAITSSRHGNPGQHEFLIPPPEEWTEFTSEVGGEGNA